MVKKGLELDLRDCLCGLLVFSLTPVEVQSVFSELCSQHSFIIKSDEPLINRAHYR